MASNIVDYKVILASTGMELQTYVVDHLKDGWELYGSAFSSPPYLTQVMVKRENPLKQFGVEYAE